MLTGAYAEGRSLLHRLPVPWKLLALAVFLVPVSLVQRPWMTAASALVTAAAAADRVAASWSSFRRKRTVPAVTGTPGR